MYNSVPKKVNSAIQAIPKFFLLSHSIFSFEEKNLNFIAGQNVKKIGHNIPINVFYIDNSKTITMFYYIFITWTE